MMNQLPSVRISGENFNLMYNLKQIYKDYKLLKDDSNKSWGAFYHEVIPEQSMSCSLQSVLNALNPVPLDVLSRMNSELALKFYNQDMILGTKMVTVQEAFLDEEQDKSLEELVAEATEFFSQMFPCSKFIVNVRSDVSAQITSQTNLGWDDRGEERLMLENQFLMQFAENMGNQATLIDMAQWRENGNVLNDVVSWLGFQQCQFSQLLHANDHSEGGYSEDQTVLNLGKECHFPNPKDAAQIANAMAMISNEHEMQRQESQEDMVVVQEEQEEDSVEVAEDNRTLKGASARTHGLLDMMNNDLQHRNVQQNDRTLVMENGGMTATSRNASPQKKAVVQGRQSKEAASAISSYLAAMNRNADGN
ncbi:predicted protein [Chaetoceros tenuissimus]|uniref:Uncharacterized protein n=1 Tax=Chaetoceros tenuissimus TaxID=426638 RepID=A0AAD3HB21_9STRA|nr:predicted protein [Chaetoceros tenuissimus]